MAKRKSPLRPKVSAVQRALRERDEALAFQAASGDILAAISRSPADATPVFEAIVNNVRRLFGTRYVAVFLVKGDELHLAASRGDAAFEKKYGAAFKKFRASFPQRIDYGGFTGKALRSGKVVQIAPIIGNPQATPQAVALAKSFGYDAMLVAPLMREGRAIGAIGTTRPEAQPFDPRALALFKAFADQAVIAIENARLFNETKEALEQQTATSEVLKTISRSTFDLNAVLQVLIENATRLAGASRGFIFRFDGRVARLAFSYNAPPAYRALIEANPIPPGRGTLVARTLLEGRPVHIPDVLADPQFTWHEAQKLGGFRSMLGVPMTRDGKPIGVIAMWSDVVKPFTDKQIELVATFADQAVIAIENVRLFNETKEALEQQTATADILKVISSSPTDDQPVFDAIVRSAERLFNRNARIRLVEGGELRLRAHSKSGPVDAAADTVMPLDSSSIAGRVALERTAMQVADIQAADAPPLRQRTGYRSMAAAPLMRENIVVGVITVWSDRPGALSEKEMALLQTFADQAVIAIENARLFNETKEALERQTATAAILRVMSGTPTDTQPVFEEIVRSAHRVVSATNAVLLLPEGSKFRVAAYCGPQVDLPDEVRHVPLDREKNFPSRAILDGEVVHVTDWQGADVPEFEKIVGDAYRVKSGVIVPLMRKGEGIGALAVAREQAGAFDEKEIALLRSFADQAVIAIENVRLFNETREALERQTATADILKVISGSPTDVQPVFDAIARNATTLCESAYANVFRYDGEQLHWVASQGGSQEVLGELRKSYPMPPRPERVVGRVVLGGQAVHVQDTLADPGYDKAFARQLPHRRILGVPLLRGGKPVGAITVAWAEPGPILVRHEELLQTFADQAVIAIENVRLFNQTREALEQQTATADVLKVMSGSPTDVQPVFNAILESAVTLCGAELAAVFSYDGKLVHLGATYKWPEEAVRYFSRIYPSPPSPKLLSGRTILAKSVVQIADSAADPNYDPNSVITGHWRRMLGAPMLREGKPLGALIVSWRDPGETPPRQVELLQTFADQAAIAIENVRLFNETKEALDQQRASAEVLRVISGSVADTEPVFEIILRSCERLFAGLNVGINVVGDDGRVHIAAYHGRGREELERHFPVPLSEASGSGAAIMQRAVVHYPDVEAPGVPEYARRGGKIAGNRSVIFAPMLWEERAIGAIFVGRDFTGPFSEKEIALLRTFADQAVIAIQNARLFREIQEKSGQLEVANKHKSDFLANMSHELRTPLNAIIGFSEVLADRMFGEVNEKQAEYLKDIHESGRHLLSLINDILDLSKIEAGRMDLELSSFDLPSAVSNAMTLIRERAQRHGITLGLDMDSRLGAFQADERKVKQILLNLLSNAVKFTPDGGRVDVSAKLDTDKVEITVKDTGIGIAPEDHAAVFEEFKQVGRDYTRKAEGTGLGLALTRRLVELHGGEIALESAIGQGSTFTVKLPLR